MTVKVALYVPAFTENVSYMKLSYCVCVCAQAHREGAHRTAHQDSSQGNHDAEGPGERHQQGGEDQSDYHD